MFIDSTTLKSVNIYAPYGGFSKLDTPEIREAAGVIEVSEPQPPVDYDPDAYYRTEQDDAPYVVYTRKSDEQIKQAADSKVKAQIAALEATQGRAVREATLTGDKTRLQALDDQIAALRAQL